MRVAGWGRSTRQVLQLVRVAVQLMEMKPLSREHIPGSQAIPTLTPKGLLILPQAAALDLRLAILLGPHNEEHGAVLAQAGVVAVREATATGARSAIMS
jgi:hypothetical protein